MADDLYHLLLVGLQGRGVEQFDHADHAVHRRPDLVAHGREESGFGTVGFLGARLGILQVLLNLALLGDVGVCADVPPAGQSGVPVLDRRAGGKSIFESVSFRRLHAVEIAIGKVALNFAAVLPALLKFDQAGTDTQQLGRKAEKL